MHCHSNYSLTLKYCTYEGASETEDVQVQRCTHFRKNTPNTWNTPILHQTSRLTMNRPRRPYCDARSSVSTELVRRKEVKGVSLPNSGCVSSSSWALGRRLEPRGIVSPLTEPALLVKVFVVVSKDPEVVILARTSPCSKSESTDSEPRRLGHTASKSCPGCNDRGERARAEFTADTSSSTPRADRCSFESSAGRGVLSAERAWVGVSRRRRSLIRLPVVALPDRLGLSPLAVSPIG